MTTAPLTSRQQAILEFIRSHLERHGFPPTRVEIAAHFGFRSPNAAEDHLRALERKGAIELSEGASRGIRLVDAGPMEESAQGLPLIGRVAAGSPILAEAHVEGHYRVDPQLFRPRADYLLRVRGMSMRDAGILDGDLLAVHAQPEAGNGQIVVARLDDEVTVKRFQRHGNVVYLLPQNPEFQPILVDLDRQPLVIEGLGVGVIRPWAQ